MIGNNNNFGTRKLALNQIYYHYFITSYLFCLSFACILRIWGLGWGTGNLFKVGQLMVKLEN